MTVKRKSEMQNPVNYWWNEFLFVKHFIVETDMPPKEAVKSLRGLHHEREGFWYPKACSVIVNDSRSAMDTSITFDIRRKRYNKRSTYTTAKAEGSVTTDGGTGLTIVRGQVKFGWVYYANVLAIPVMFVLFLAMRNAARNTLSNSPSILPFFAIFALMIVWYWWSLFRDRNQLITTIADALDSRKAKEK